MATLPYAPTSWVAGTTACSQANMNNLESQAAVALSSFNPDLLSAFVLSGLVATKDGTIASQLDVTAGKAYLTQTDGTLGLRSLASFTKTTTTPSTTYFLDLNPDGSVSWGTSHSAVTNHLTIASVTTDGSSNILVVTDARPLNTTLLNGFTGLLTVGGGIFFGPTANPCLLNLDTVGHFVNLWAPSPAGTAYSIDFHPWTGSTNSATLHLDGATGLVHVYTNLTVDNSITASKIASLGGQTTAGSFGAPVIVAQTIHTLVTATTQQSILVYTAPATGLYQVNCHIAFGNGTAQLMRAWVAYTDPDLGNPATFFQSNQLVAHTVTVLDGSTNAAAGTSIPTTPQTIYAKGGTTISVLYLDPGGTPNDHITAQIMQLA